MNGGTSLRIHGTRCLLLLILVACSPPSGQAPQTGSSSTTLATPRAQARKPERTSRIARPSELTEQERRYGISQTHNDQVIYQPDVILIDNGSLAIRGISRDGLVWREDASSVPAVTSCPAASCFSRAEPSVAYCTWERKAVRSRFASGPCIFQQSSATAVSRWMCK